MKRQSILVLIAILVPAASASGDMTWYSSHHVIQSGDLIEDTLRIYNGTTVDMSGGEITGSLGIHNTSSFNFSDGFLH